MDKVDPELYQYFQNISKQSAEEADEIINYKLPQKIKSLSEISQEVLHSCMTDMQTETIDIYSPVIESNPKIIETLSKVKNELYEFLDICVKLKFWIQLNIPKIEEGNNFGVEVQNEMLEMLDSGRSSASNILELLSSYFAVRGESIQEWQRNPYVKDLQVSCSYVDQKQLISLSHGLMDLKNSYTILYDKITKNFEKIKKPKGNHHEQHHLDFFY